MAKKNYRADNTYLIEGSIGDNPKLMGRALENGRDRLYLEFYYGKVEAVSKNGKSYLKTDRDTEMLGLYLWRAPRTPQERQQNKETIEIAKRIRYERSQELLENTEGYRLKKGKSKNLNFIKWMRSYYDAYIKLDKRMIKSAYNSFVDYLIDPKGLLLPKPDWEPDKVAEAKALRQKKIKSLHFNSPQLTKKVIEGYTDYLQKRFSGEGPHSVYQRFKKIIKAAVDAEILRMNPCEGVVIKSDNGVLRKDVLSSEEMQQLIATHYAGENTEIRRAFILCLYCGLRWCDVKDLTYANVDYANRLLKFEQTKTKGHSAASGVVIPLNDGLLNLIGKGERNAPIFTLPSHKACLNALRHWTARAEIEKHITWHCARHSFAVNILNNGANIKTVASLLGHSGLSQTEKYTRAVDSLKEAAINSLPELKI